MQSYYSVTPSFITRAKDLSSNEKVLYGVLSGLMSKYGFCWASNRYIADQAGMNIRQVQRCLEHMKSLNYIIVEIEHHNERKIWTADTYANRESLIKAFSEEEINQRFYTHVKNDMGVRQKCHTPAIYKVIDKKIDKKEVVGNIDKPQIKKAQPPPSFLQMSEDEESKLIEIAGKKLAKKYSANAARTLTSVRFKDSPLRQLSHYELAVKYFREDAADREKEASAETKEDRDNKAWIEAIAKKNKIVERDLLISKSYCVLFPTVCGEGPQFYYADSDFKQLVRDRYAFTNKKLQELSDE